MNLSLTLLDWVVCVAVVSATVLLGLHLAVRRHAGESSANFFLAGRRLTWPIVGASLFATNIGAEHLVGLSGDAYRYGVCAGTVELTTAIALGIRRCHFCFPTTSRTRSSRSPSSWSCATAAWRALAFRA